jgi:hypothetical protein
VLIGAAMCACSALAQQPLFSNASSTPGSPALNPQSNAADGTPAPSGFTWSESSALTSQTEANALAGVACHLDTTDLTGGVRLSDDFTVPAGENWILDQVWVYVYQPGWASLSPPVSSATMRIWAGRPGQLGSGIVWGDESTNRLDAVDPTPSYRIFSTVVGPVITSADTSRRIYRVVLDAQASLAPGHYALDWRVTPQTSGNELYAVPATLPLLRTGSNWNAQQYLDGAWSPIMDDGKPVTAPDVGVDLAFVLSGTIVPACDSIDFNADGLFPDTLDLEDFLSVFSGGPCSTGTCGDIDFNNDGLFPDTLDVEAYVSVFSGGACI